MRIPGNRGLVQNALLNFMSLKPVPKSRREDEELAERKSEGFSLVESLLVIVLVGIVLSLGFTVYGLAVRAYSADRSSCSAAAGALFDRVFSKGA